MFPGIDGFHWTVTHVVFLALFFAVVMTIVATVVSAAVRTARDFRTNKAIRVVLEGEFCRLAGRRSALPA